MPGYGRGKLEITGPCAPSLGDAPELEPQQTHRAEVMEVGVVESVQARDLGDYDDILGIDLDQQPALVEVAQ